MLVRKLTLSARPKPLADIKILKIKYENMT
jgi:hypothetical protein